MQLCGARGWMLVSPQKKLCANNSHCGVEVLRARGAVDRTTE